MSRPQRLEFSGALYHVTSRGDGREAIYLDDADRALFLDVLAGTNEQFNWAIHAYCLMGNHYHLLVETGYGLKEIGDYFGLHYSRVSRIVGKMREAT